MSVAIDPRSIYLNVEVEVPLAVNNDGMPRGTTYSKAAVALGRNNLLICDTHKGNDWCPHIEKVITENLDSQFFDTQANMTGVTIPVPLIPTADQWAIVLFGELVEKVHAYKVYFRADSESSFNIDELPFLGFFSLGEGRAVLRGMVYDYFRGELARARAEKIKIQCNQASHSYKQELQWQKDMKPNATADRRLLQLWSVLNANACLGCANKVDTEEEDLIPDPGGRPGRSPF